MFMFMFIDHEFVPQAGVEELMASTLIAGLC